MDASVGKPFLLFAHPPVGKIVRVKVFLCFQVRRLTCMVQLHSSENLAASDALQRTEEFQPPFFLLFAFWVFFIFRVFFHSDIIVQSDRHNCRSKAGAKLVFHSHFLQEYPEARGGAREGDK